MLIFQVDLVKRHCFPVYWNGEDRRVLRGHWFARKGGPTWLPLREDVSEQLEYAYRCQVFLNLDHICLLMTFLSMYQHFPLVFGRQSFGMPKFQLMRLGFLASRFGIDEPFNHQVYLLLELIYRAQPQYGTSV